MSSGLDGGATGVQFNIPVSKRLTGSLVAHLNAGATYIPGMKDESTPAGLLRYTLSSLSVGTSLVWLTPETHNIMLEYTATFSRDSYGSGVTERLTDMIISPGVRYAINLNSLQIVPGLVVPAMIHNGTVTMGIFTYLSFEHPY